MPSIAQVRITLRRTLTAAVAALLAAGPGAAQEPPSLRGAKVHEELRNDALIAGNWIIGAHLLARRSTVAPRLFAVIPGTDAWRGQTLCARATDKEGRYSALFEYAIPDDWPGGPVNLPYDSAFRDHAARITERDGGVALHRGSCAQVSDTFLPAIWNADLEPRRNASGGFDILLNLNVGRADSLIATASLVRPGKAATPADITCAPLAEGGVGFNYQCLSHLPPDGSTGALEVEVTRLRYGEAGPPRRATIQLAPLNGQ